MRCYSLFMLQDLLLTEPAFICIAFWTNGPRIVDLLTNQKGNFADFYSKEEMYGTFERDRLRYSALPQLTPVLFFKRIIAFLIYFQVVAHTFNMT